MNERERTRFSKFLSLVLRHQPQRIGISLSDAGWVEVVVLLKQCEKHRKAISREMLDEIVKTSPKQRFAFSDDGLCIRANQGHSVDVNLGYEQATPPKELFHGTVAKSLAAIQHEGLSKMRRHHVHLSPDRETASRVGQRRGKPVILVIEAQRMAQEGHRFFISPNGVWLIAYVPPEFINFPC